MRGWIALGLLMASPLAAQEVVDCGFAARADAIYEPWEEFSRTYANGEVRVALLDTIEPAAGSFHVLVLSPPYDEVGGRQCKTIGLENNIGFSGIGFEEIQADYDPALGLTFHIEVTYYEPEFADYLSGSLIFSLNQQTGAIEAILE